jgi:predicted nucleic acid-binding protein
MEKKRILVDTDILIKLFRGNEEIRKNLKPIEEQLSISVITAMELLQGVRNENQFLQMRKAIHSYELLHINTDLSETAFRLINKYSKNHRVRIADIFIAATAIYNKIIFNYTLIT